MKKILVVDDEERIRRIYTALFSLEGFEVASAANAQDANELLKKERPDLVLLDIRMPETDGTVVNELIRLFYPRTKVVISSVFPVDEQKREIEGAADYYDKSESIDILVAKVKQALGLGCRKAGIVW